MSSYYQDLVHKADHLHNDFHGKMDNNSYAAKRLYAKTKEFREYAQSHDGSPHEIADHAKALSEEFRRVEHSSGQNSFMSSGQAREFRHQYRDMYDKMRYMHTFK